MANRSKANEFVKKWNGRGDEKQDTSRFWMELLSDVYGDTEIYNPEHLLFEVPTGKKNKKGKEFKDVVINRRSENATLIEQKSFDIGLDHATKQSDGSLLTPFEQAKKYDDNSTVDDKARWIITCNFQNIWIYDMKKDGVERFIPTIIKLEELPSKIEWLDFLLSNYSEDNPSFVEETAVSVDAGKLVGKMYDALLSRYADPESEQTQKELNKLCVRLVFCLYADDAGLFDKNDTSKFENYIKNTDTKYVRQALIDLFKVLDQKEAERDKYLDDTLKSFPYVNGGLFKGDVEIPNFDDALKKLLVEDESASFDWSVVSPTIFGAVFESTLNTETRRSGGMHYTSIENIHKVIDPLFLDDLKKELNDALSYSVSSKKEKALREFQERISNLTFLDPACGSGNFLTETYLGLRRLENEVIRQLQGINVALNFENDSVIKVSIQQFYGIEINDFAVSVAKTALWIAESQMFRETETILSGNREYFPLQQFNNILEGNALRTDWEEVVSRDKLNYIMGNPPFYGAKNISRNQKEELLSLFGNGINAGLLDYVTGWYYKSAKYILNTSIECAFVSTNSITQGEQVSILWKVLEKNNIKINFAYKSFVWDSEANTKAHVHCVIIGFSNNDKTKIIFDGENTIFPKHINGYLLDAPNIYAERRSLPICNVPECTKGNQPTDGGNLIIENKDYQSFISKEPNAKKWIKKLIGSEEFINNKDRYCLWLVGCPPEELKKMPLVIERVEKCRESRIKNNPRLAETPTLFRETRNPESCLVIPVVSSESRQYIPMGFINQDTIAKNQVIMIPKANNYHFGILMSSVHMAWMRVIAGRLEMRYSYSAKIVYNNFPWPMPTEEQKERIEKTAQTILDVRANYQNSSLATLYNPTLMPIELKKAHIENDKAVMEAYGFSKNTSESEIVAKLFKLYESLAEPSKESKRIA